LKQGTEIKIPGFKNDPNGFTYTAYKDNETITKIAEAQFVGAIILADLNGLDYTFTEKRGVATFQLEKDGAAIPGLFPGDKLKLPAGATYQVASGDTKQSIATRHGISVSQLESLNKNVDAALAADKPLPFENTLTLPKQVAVVQEGQTLGTIASQHGLKVDDLATENNIAVDAVVATGTALKLPASAKYIVQTGDTWADVATAHGVTPDELAQANGLKASDPLKSVVVLQLPQIDGYVVQGQDLKLVAAGYGNVTADSLASKNGLKATDVLRIGTQLKLPDDAWGSAPPDAKNPGTACVQYAVPKSIFESISGTQAAVTAPPTVSKDVKIEAHANDWTVTADGTAQPANKGVVLIAKGTAVAFDSIVGLHTITINGKKDGDNLKQGDKRTITFNDSGTFKITCDFHPDMLANVFVQ
jgi:LysM repeat protein